MKKRIQINVAYGAGLGLGACTALLASMALHVEPITLMGAVTASTVTIAATIAAGAPLGLLFRMLRRSPFAFVGGISALVLGEVGEEALSALRAQRESALATAQPADMGSVKCRYLLLTAGNVALVIGDRIKAFVFPSTKLD